ncbi:hypothetical protein [Asticcacaulis tiandongensis]|uniref:hypothetical protein n=1 Tax=Asticcacaulis tiandongensis TaxID=2565365 RepID=UPI00112DF8A8|nr:hypothetical protein [Asticcacaulis tiandongensis]
MMEDDDIGEWFARLTACLEDATELAIAGQNQRLSLNERKALLAEIQHHLAVAHRVTGQLKQMMQDTGAS